MHTPIEFNPAVPLPRKTLSNMMATGAGHADWGRLYWTTVGGTFSALVILVFLPAWWLAATPLVCLSSFAAWGLAAQKTIALDRKRIAAPSLRLSLQLARGVAALTGALSALAGLFGGFALLLQP